MSHKLVYTPIIKPVNGLCNLACSYCYTFGLRNFSVKKCMQKDVLKKTIDFFCKEQEDVEFIWHGGEPLLAGLDFYRKVIEFQYPWKQQGRNIMNFIQTNGTLVTSKWTDFFAKNDFFIGVSVDGRKEYHNKNRCYKSGKGSYDDVMRGINLLYQAGVFNGVICSVSSINYEYPEDLLHFFIDENIKKLKFARVKETGCCNNVSSLIISPKLFTDFMIAIFDLWLELDDPEIEIRDIESVVNLLLGGDIRECIYMGQCNRFVTVYSDGSISRCDSFPRVDAFNFGCVFDEKSAVEFSYNMQKFRKILEKRKEYCQNCEWYFICQGGCAKDYYEHFDSIKPSDEICKNLKRYFKHISAKIKSYDLI